MTYHSFWVIQLGEGYSLMDQKHGGKEWHFVDGGVKGKSRVSKEGILLCYSMNFIKTVPFYLASTSSLWYSYQRSMGHQKKFRPISFVGCIFKLIAKC